MHSGCITGSDPLLPGVKPDHYFNTDWNKQIAVDAVGLMAQKCAAHSANCYGVGALNEP
jgi:hypothetical protein